MKRTQLQQNAFPTAMIESVALMDVEEHVEQAVLARVSAMKLWENVFVKIWS